MINQRKLKAKIVEMGYTQNTLSDELGMHEVTFNAKLHGRNGREFTTGEAARIADRLHFSDRDIIDIFFAQ